MAQLLFLGVTRDVCYAYRVLREAAYTCTVNRYSPSKAQREDGHGMKNQMCTQSTICDAKKDGNGTKNSEELELMFGRVQHEQELRFFLESTTLVKP